MDNDASLFGKEFFKKSTTGRFSGFTRRRQGMPMDITLKYLIITPEKRISG